MTLGPLTPVSPAHTAYEHVRATLRSGILSGSLAAGTRLVQAQIAEQLGVSTTPVREALRDLTREGLVVFDAHRGATVRAVDIHTVREVYQLRMFLEPIMVERTIGTLSEEQLSRAESYWQQMETESDIGNWVGLNRQFHSVFSEPDGESRLATILMELRDSATVYVAVSLSAQPDQATKANKDHGELIAYYRAQDLDAAIELTGKHLQSTLAIIEHAHQLGLLPGEAG